MPRSRKRRWLACVFRVGRTIAGDRPPRYGPGKGSPRHAPFLFTVGRGPVPRHASVEETALVGVRFSRGSGDRGGQAPALRLKKRAVYRRARACPSPCLDRNGKRLWLAFGFRAGRAIAGDRPPRYGPGRFSSPCAVREQALPNYSFLPLIVEIVIIV